MKELIVRLKQVVSKVESIVKSYGFDPQILITDTEIQDSFIDLAIRGTMEECHALFGSIAEDFP
ncbi:hypothetical protein [Paenibacillus graminis]|nr:hypothetical protein [Paenibacillus graminis]MEC0171155.1 hypothetical protein [Paenibacillus graminis]